MERSLSSSGFFWKRQGVLARRCDTATAVHRLSKSVERHRLLERSVAGDQRFVRARPDERGGEASFALAIE